MSCPFSVIIEGEIYDNISCNKTEEKIECPFSNECNNYPIWDSISIYISKGIKTYEKAMELKEENNVRDNK